MTGRHRAEEDPDWHEHMWCCETIVTEDEDDAGDD